MIWDDVRRTFEDYFLRSEFSFEILHAEDPNDTECSAVLKIGEGPREQKMTVVLESEDNIGYLRILSPVVNVARTTPEQLLRLMEQNTHWVQVTVGVLNKEVVFTALVPLREFEHDPAALGDAMTRVARRADQMERLLFGRDH
ncbi:MAG: hypothetical protein WC423_26635 [Vulcanimicrobiota bacterium]